MKDNEIVELFFKRDEAAIGEAASKYEKYCYSIAMGILHNEEDAKEIVNDTWVGAWNSIPPHRPAILSTFLGKITRRTAINRYREKNAKKRGGGQVDLVLEELAETISTGKSIDSELENKELAAVINSFLDTLPIMEQKVFICRYWYMDSVAEIADRFSFSQSKVKTMLHRTRKKLKIVLEREGILI